MFADVASAVVSSIWACHADGATSSCSLSLHQYVNTYLQVVSVLWLQGILENQIAASSAQYQQLQQQLQAVERNRTDLEASWLHNRRLNHAARVIQRRYRVWRSRTHVAKFGRDAEVCCLILLRVSCVCLDQA